MDVSVNLKTMRIVLAAFIALGIFSVCRCSPRLDKYNNGYPPDIYERERHPDNNNLDDDAITLKELLRAYELLKEGQDLDKDAKGYAASDTPKPVTTTDLPAARNIKLASAIADSYMEQLEADTRDAQEPDIYTSSQALRSFNAPRSTNNNPTETRDMAELEALALLTSSDELFLREIQESGIFNRVIDPNCKLTVNCTDEANLNMKDGVEYRTMNGMCNNQAHFAWGMANAQHVRLLENAYENKKNWAIRITGINGERLPSARNVSNVVHNSTVNKPESQTLAIALFYFMQFIDHDLAKTPEGHVDDDVDCCAKVRVKGPKGKFCLRLEVRRIEEDHFDDEYCFFSRRSQIVKMCEGNVQNQMNEITSYMDASMVYGSSDEEMNRLRTKVNGRLLVSNEEFPPVLDDARHFPCNGTEANCFETGDARANVHPGLLTYHTLFVREHNRIVKILAREHTDWDDEKLFQEGRKIIAAMIQHITYTYMLPKLFDASQLSVHNVSKTYAYDNTKDATMTQAFSMGYRYHHLMPDQLHLAHIDGGTVRNYKTIPQELAFLRPHFLTDDGYGGINEVALGMVQSKCPHASRQVNNATRNLLFLDKNGSSSDLIALNIMRAREWGMPSYTEYVKLCNPAKDPRTWDDLKDVMSNDAIEQLKKVYSDVRDIDLWTGLVSETPLEGSISGPTQTCLLSKHFANIKHGDRFWYEAPGQFTEDQLTQIKKTTLARILCSNLDGVTKMREDVFDIHSVWTNCNTIVENHDMEFFWWNTGS